MAELSNVFAALSIDENDENADVVAHDTGEERPPLLRPKDANDFRKKVLAVDLDETLIHATVQHEPGTDFVVTTRREGRNEHTFHVAKRPFVDRFIEYIDGKFECVIFTASTHEYAKAVMEQLDPNGVFEQILSREACVFENGAYIKDLSHFGRDLNEVMLLDNTPFAYSRQPKNGVPIRSWNRRQIDDFELLALMPVLEDALDLKTVYDLDFWTRQLRFSKWRRPSLDFL